MAGHPLKNGYLMFKETGPPLPYRSGQIDKAPGHRDIVSDDRPRLGRPLDFQMPEPIGIDRSLWMLVRGIGIVIQRFNAHLPDQPTDTTSTDLDASQPRDLGRLYEWLHV